MNEAATRPQAGSRIYLARRRVAALKRSVLIAATVAFGTAMLLVRATNAGAGAAAGGGTGAGAAASKQLDAPTSFVAAVREQSDVQPGTISPAEAPPVTRSGSS